MKNMKNMKHETIGHPTIPTKDVARQKNCRGSALAKKKQHNKCFCRSKCVMKIHGHADEEQHEPHELGCCDVLGSVSQPIKKTHYRVPVDFGAA